MFDSLKSITRSTNALQNSNLVGKCVSKLMYTERQLPGKLAKYLKGKKIWNYALDCFKSLMARLGFERGYIEIAMGSMWYALWFADRRWTTRPTRRYSIRNLYVLAFVSNFVVFIVVKAVLHEPPRRVLAPLPFSPISVSDYLFPGEGPADSLTSLADLLDLGTLLEGDVQVWMFFSLLLLKC